MVVRAPAALQRRRERAPPRLERGGAGQQRGGGDGGEAGGERRRRRRSCCCGVKCGPAQRQAAAAAAGRGEAHVLDAHLVRRERRRTRVVDRAGRRVERARRERQPPRHAPARLRGPGAVPVSLRVEKVVVDPQPRVRERRGVRQRRVEGEVEAVVARRGRREAPGEPEGGRTVTRGAGGVAVGEALEARRDGAARAGAGQGGVVEAREREAAGCERRRVHRQSNRQHLHSARCWVCEGSARVTDYSCVGATGVTRDIDPGWYALSLRKLGKMFIRLHLLV